MLIQKIKDHLEENPKATPKEIAKAIGEREPRVLSGLKEIAAGGRKKAKK